MTSFKPRQIVEDIEILTEPERRRLRSVQEKLAILQQTLEPSATVSAVAHLCGANPNQVFAWRKQYQDRGLTALKAGEFVVPPSQLASTMKEIREPRRLLGKKTHEAGILKEAVEYGRSKNWIVRSPHCPGQPTRTVSDILGVAHSAVAVKKMRSSYRQDSSRAWRIDNMNKSGVPTSLFHLGARV